MVRSPGLGMVLWRRGGVFWRGMAASIAVFAALSALAAGGLASRLVLDVSAAGSVVVLAVGGACFSRRWTVALPLSLFGAAFVLSAAHTVAQSAAQEGVFAIDTDRVLSAAEVAGLAFAFATPLMAWPSAGRFSTAVGVAVTLVAYAAFLGNGSTTRFLLLWNEGLSGIMPSFLYAIAAGCLAGTLVALLRNGNQVAAAGLVLLVTGGIGLYSTYQSGLAIAGMVLLSLGLAAAGRPARAIRDAGMSAAHPQGVR